MNRTPKTSIFAKPRIAMVAYTHLATDPRCRREAALAAEAGWDVHFYALSTDGCGRTITFEGVTLHQMPMSRYRGGSSSAYIMSYLHFLILAGVQVMSDHLRCRYKIVHVNTMPDFMVCTALLPRLYGAKVILDIHDVMPEIYMTKFRVSERHWKIRLIKWMEVASARVAHLVLTAEHPKAELLVAHGIPAGKIEVLLNLPDDRLFTPQFLLAGPEVALPIGDSGAEFRLFYHGTLAPRLGMDIAIDALAQLRDVIPGATLRLFGDGDHAIALRKQVDALGLGSRVRFSDGFRPIEEIIPHIRRAHLAVLPTRHEISTDYMLPTKLLEYLAFGIPAIFTPTKTVKYYFGENHPLYINDPSPLETARKIRWVRENYAEAKMLTASLQDQWFSRYHWPEHKRLYTDALQRLLG